MPTDECWELLDARMVGRLAWHEDTGPAIVPVNYVVGDGYVYFRTKPESRIGRNAMLGAISFQVDDVDDFNQSGWSVLVRGRAARRVPVGLGHPEQLARAGPPPRHPDPARRGDRAPAAVELNGLRRGTSDRGRRR